MLPFLVAVAGVAVGKGAADNRTHLQSYHADPGPSTGNAFPKDNRTETQADPEAEGSAQDRPNVWSLLAGNNGENPLPGHPLDPILAVSNLPVRAIRG